MSKETRKRLFTVGCSYTQYNWPTYAEFLGTQYDYCLNLGQAGAGNDYIFNAANFIYDYFKPTANDTVIVQWSGVGRLDHIPYNSTEYESCGNLDWQDIYPREYVKKYFNIVQSAYSLKNYASSIYVTSKLFGSKFITFNMLDPWFELFFGEPFNTSIFDDNLKYVKDHYPFELLKDTFNRINSARSLEEFCWEYTQDVPIYNFFEGEVQEDTHPSPNQHLAYSRYLNNEYNLGIEGINDTKLDNFSQVYQDVFENKLAYIQKSYESKKGYFVPLSDTQHVLEYNGSKIRDLFNVDYISAPYSVDRTRWTQL